MRFFQFSPNPLDNQEHGKLQAMFIFGIMVAGKNADTQADKLNALLAGFAGKPFDMGGWGDDELMEYLVYNRTGKYKLLHSALKWCYAHASNDFLRWASIDELQKCPGVGPKTSRFFCMYTREDTWAAVLDVHILRWLKLKGYPHITRQTPSTELAYKRIEWYFLDECHKYGCTPAELDYTIWLNAKNYGAILP